MRAHLWRTSQGTRSKHQALAVRDQNPLNHNITSTKPITCGLIREETQVPSGAYLPTHTVVGTRHQSDVVLRRTAGSWIFLEAEMRKA